MSKIPFMKVSDMEALKANAKNHVTFYSQETNAWIEQTLHHSPFGDTKYDLPELSLYMPAVGRFSPSTDKLNVREVYGKLRWLSDSQASDERLWAGLCFGPFWEYVHYRWKIDTADSIKQHYFFAYTPRRSLTRNAVSRLWWIGRLTYDGSREDPFELTDFVCENSRFIVDVLERNVSNSKPIMREFLSACIEAKKQGLTMDTNTIRELEKYLDLLGGIYILDCMPEGFVYKKILTKASQLMLFKENKVAGDTEPESGDNHNTISKNSVIVVSTTKGQKIMLDLGKKVYHTKPKSLIGKGVGESFIFGGFKVTIQKIKNRNSKS